MMHLSKRFALFGAGLLLSIITSTPTCLAVSDDELLLHIPEGVEVSIATEEKDFALREGVCEEIPEGRSVLVFVDTSGSMIENNRLESAKSAAIKTVKALGEKDEVALATFGQDWCSVRIVQGYTSDKSAVLSQISSIGITRYSGTPLAKAIRQTGAYLRNNARTADMSLVVLSDGMDGCGRGVIGSPKFELARHKRRKADGSVKKIQVLAVDARGNPVSDSEVAEGGKVMLRVIYKRPPELDEVSAWLTSGAKPAQEDKRLVTVRQHKKFSCVYESKPVEVVSK